MFRKANIFNLVAFLAVLGLLGGCTTLKLETYAAHPVNDYNNSQVKSGLAIAVHPLLDSLKSKKYFGVDLLSVDTVPIYIAAENRNPKSNFIIKKDSIHLNSKTEPMKSKLREDIDSVRNSAAQISYALMSPLFMVAGLKMESDGSIIKHSIVSQEFQSKTLSPNQKTGGFLYFRLPESKDSFGVVKLSLEAVDPVNKESFTFYFEINLEELSRNVR